MLETSVSEIHSYPLRPEGFEEPLFPTRESRRAVAEHLLRAPWLVRASEIGGRVREPVEVRRAHDGIEVVWTSGCGRRRFRERRRVVEVLDRWREVRHWWDADGTDRFVFRVLLTGGMVVDLARERSSWFLMGVPD